MNKSHVKCTLDFAERNEGGFRNDLTAERLFILVRFSDEADLSYGALVVRDQTMRLGPGANAMVDLVFVNDVDVRKHLVVGKEFVFGDNIDRGVGEIVEVY